MTTESITYMNLTLTPRFETPCTVRVFNPRLVGYWFDCVRSYLAKVDIDLWCNDWTTLKPVARDDIAPFVVASFDIEVTVLLESFLMRMYRTIHAFRLPSHCVFGNDEPYEKVCLCYKKTEGPDVVSFDTEKGMLEAFQKYLLMRRI